MSIILKGLDIPKDHSIIIEIDEHGEVCEHVKCDQVVHIEPWAKAIQIPKDHGKLVEELEKKLYEYIDPFEVPGALEACYDTMEAFYDAMDRFTKGE